MANTSQGSAVTFKATPLAEVVNVSVNQSKEAAASGDNRVDISHIGLAAGANRHYMAALLVDVPTGAASSGIGGDITVEMLTNGPSAGSTGALTVKGGGYDLTLTCVQVTSSGFTLATAEVARTSVTFTIQPDDVCTPVVKST
jgi:hypothetical protein